MNLQFGEWVEHMIIDAETGDRDSFLIRKISFEDDSMSKNGLCLCGSGLEKELCHGEIHEKSVIANLYKVFAKVDYENSKIPYSICRKGCRDCCASYFNVSLVEYFMVLQHLWIPRNNAKLLDYVMRAERLSRNRDFPLDDTYDIPGFPNCLFLNETMGFCEVYEVRPLLCRLYGNVTRLTKCPKILNDPFAQKVLLESGFDDSLSTNIDTFQHGKNSLRPPPHPLLYWFSTLREDGEFQTQRMRDLFNASFGQSADEFVEILLM